MKPHFSNQRTIALTLVEVLVVIVVVFALLIIVSLPHLRAAVWRENCIQTLKADGFAFRLWAGDNNDKLPMEVSTNNGGAKEWLSQGDVFHCWEVMSNELCNPRILVCPADKREFVTNWGTFNNHHLSYFIGIDAKWDKNYLILMPAFLCGDRNLTNSIGIKNGILELTAEQSVGWTHEIHNSCGNICIVDGSVQELNNSNLRAALQVSGVATNRLAIP